MRPIVIAKVQRNGSWGLRLMDIDSKSIMDTTVESVANNILKGMNIIGASMSRNELSLESNILPCVQQDGAVINMGVLVAIEELPNDLYRVVNFNGKIGVSRLNNGIVKYSNLPKGEEFCLYEHKDKLVKMQRILKPMYEVNEHGMAKLREDVNQSKIKEELIFPDGVLGIEGYGFQNLKGVKKIVLPETCEYIGIYAFDFCKDLESVEIKGNTEVISCGAFHGCIKLKKVIISPYTKKIEKYAFQDCSSLREIKFRGKGKLPEVGFAAIPPACVIKRISK